MVSYAAIDRSIAKLGEMIEQRRGAPRPVKADLTRRIEARRGWINRKVAHVAAREIASEADRAVHACIGEWAAAMLGSQESGVYVWWYR